MEKHSIVSYSADIGERFINTITEGSASHKRAIHRSVHVLSDYLSYGKVRARIVPYVNHELTGEIGEIARTARPCIFSKRELIWCIYAIS